MAVAVVAEGLLGLERRNMEQGQPVVDSAVAAFGSLWMVSTNQTRSECTRLTLRIRRIIPGGVIMLWYTSLCRITWPSIPILPRTGTAISLRRLRHRLFKESVIISPSFDEFLVQLSEIIFTEVLAWL